MRRLTKRNPRRGTVNIKKRFLLFPRKLRQEIGNRIEWRWLEVARIRKVYHSTQTGTGWWGGGHWAQDKEKPLRLLHNVTPKRARRADIDEL